MGWTQEMQSHWRAFQASRLRFGPLCWWFCGLGLRDQSVLGFLLLRDLTSKLPGCDLLEFFWYMGTFHSKEFQNVYCCKVKFFYKQYCFCDFALLLEHANRLFVCHQRTSNRGGLDHGVFMCGAFHLLKTDSLCSIRLYCSREEKRKYLSFSLSLFLSFCSH